MDKYTRFHISVRINVAIVSSPCNTTAYKFTIILEVDCENLEWTDSKTNTQYHLKKLSETTDYYNNRKLTKDDVKYIRKNKGTISSGELAKIFNVSKTTILNAQNYKLYN